MQLKVAYIILEMPTNGKVTMILLPSLKKKSNKAITKSFFYNGRGIVGLKVKSVQFMVKARDLQLGSEEKERGYLMKLYT